MNRSRPLCFRCEDENQLTEFVHKISLREYNVSKDKVNADCKTRLSSNSRAGLGPNADRSLGPNK